MSVRRLLNLVLGLITLAAAIYVGYLVHREVRVDKRSERAKERIERENRRVPQNPGQPAITLAPTGQTVGGLTVRMEEGTVREQGIEVRLVVENNTGSPITLDPETWKVRDARGRETPSFPSSGTGAFRPNAGVPEPIAAGATTGGFVRYRPFAVGGERPYVLHGLANDPGGTYQFNLTLR
jgi:hypothetical protein